MMPSSPAARIQSSSLFQSPTRVTRPAIVPWHIGSATWTLTSWPSAISRMYKAPRSHESPMPRNLIAGFQLRARSGRRAMRRIESEFCAIALKRARPMPEPHERALADRARPTRILHDQRPHDFTIPLLGVLHVEHGMKREVMPLLWRDAEPPQSLVDIASARRCGHFDHS